MKKILIIGGGAMGSAFTIPCLENNHKVTITEPYSKTFIRNLSSKNKFHSALKIKLPKKLRFRKFSNDLLREKFDLIVIALSLTGIDFIGKQLKNLNIGVSTSVGIGGDPINGSSFKDIIERFEQDPETDAVLMIGEIGGPQEVAAGQFAKENMKKPVIAYIAGLTAPKGRVMGHAGAIVSAYGESAIEKVEILKECGIEISKNPSVMGDTVKSVLDKNL